MQYAVPQFTDVEDKLIGPLTLKQFLIILATGGVIMFFYSLLKLSIFFFVFAIPFAFLGLALTFAKFNGRPLFGYLGSFISFVAKPQVRVFKREDNNMTLSFKAEKKVEPVVTKTTTLEEPKESRLKKLAYMLDQQTAEEKELVGKQDLSTIK